MFFGQPFGGLITGARGAVLTVLLRTGEGLTGRQIGTLVSPAFSLWSVQEALKGLHGLGLLETQSVGRAMLHSINESHYAVAPLRALLDPIAALRDAVRDVVSDQVGSVLLFGSIARGEARADSDVDLAVIAPAGWDRRVELEDQVRTRLGNHCEVLLFSPEDFGELAEKGEPVVAEILRDGVALVGNKPQLAPAAR